MKNISSSIITIISLYVLFCFFLYVYQRDFLYFPTPQLDHQHDSITFNNEGESINVIVLNEGSERAILYFGGNGEAVVYGAAEHINNFPDHTVYLVNYRGYGGSSGSPSEDGIYSDALYIYDQLAAEHRSISVIGRSLGTGVATYIAANRQVDKIALITPFDSIESLAQTHYPIFPISLLIRDRFDSIGRSADITAQTLIILAEHDRVIPAEHSIRLINAFRGDQVQVKTIRDAGHNDLSRAREYHSFLRQFM